jgi:hypothetical protein
MEKTNFFSAIGKFFLIAMMFVYGLPANAAGINGGRGDLSPVGGNQLLPLGRAIKGETPAANILIPKSIDANITDLGPQRVQPDPPVDLNGDGKTDFVVVRNTGGGANGQLTWYLAFNGGGTGAVNWGLNSDWILTEDFDGDFKDDITIWRPGTGGAAAFYSLLSGSNTVRIDQFGQTGDIPSITADYDGDGKADSAVYRIGSPSNWFYRSSLTGTLVVVQWGMNGDIPVPGDWDGDGKWDFGIARDSGSGPLNYWRLLSNGTVLPVVAFGTTADFTVPGDYDGDHKTDIATVRETGGPISWQFVRSSDNSIGGVTWGTGNDFPVQGDYDGDGKTDVAIYRRGTNPGESAFWVLNSSNGSFTVVQWGLPGDFPAAAYNVF